MFAVVYQGRAITPALFDPEVGIDFPRMLHGGQEFRWGRVVVAGDEIDTTTSVKDIWSRGGMNFYVFETDSRNQRGEIRVHRYLDEHREGRLVAPRFDQGDPVHLEVTPDRFVTVRYAGASGDFNPIHIDEEFARSVGLPGRILHGLWTMAQVARAHTDAAGGPEKLKRLSVQFRGMGRMEEPVVVVGAVRVGCRTGSRSSTRRPSSRVTGSSATRSRKSQSTDRRSGRAGPVRGPRGARPTIIGSC